MPDSVVGVVGGMGPLATVAFYQHLVTETDAPRDQDHLRILIDADPTVPDRSAFLAGRGPDPRPKIYAMVRRLKGEGANPIVMACNTAHVFARDVETATGVTLFPWVETCIDAAERALTPDSRTVGLLATDGTVRSGIYQDALAQRNLTCVLPTPSEQSAVMEAIYGPDGVKSIGHMSSRARSRLVRIAERFVEEGVGSIILGCTELPLALPPETDTWPMPAIDPAWHVARQVISDAGARSKDR